MGCCNSHPHPETLGSAPINLPSSSEEETQLIPPTPPQFSSPDASLIPDDIVSQNINISPAHHDVHFPTGATQDASEATIFYMFLSQPDFDENPSSPVPFFSYQPTGSKLPKPTTVRRADPPTPDAIIPDAIVSSADASLIPYAVASQNINISPARHDLHFPIGATQDASEATVLDMFLSQPDFDENPSSPVAFFSYKPTGSKPPKATTVMKADPPPISTSQETPGTFSTDPQISSSWVYLNIIEHDTNQVFYAFNVHTTKSFRFPPLSEALLNSATAVFDRKLYVIGGSGRDGNPSRMVYMCDPFTAGFTWLRLPDMNTARENAVAATAKGKICVFGGCRGHHPHPEDDLPWAEEYDLSAFQWTAIGIPAQEFSFSVSGHPLHAAVFRDQIFIRNDCSGIAYNAISSTWEKIPENVSSKWFKWASAVEVAGLLVTYYKVKNSETRLGAYRPESGTWLPLQNLLAVYHNPEVKFNFLSVNGNLVVYHMWDRPQPLTLTVMKVIKHGKPPLKVQILKTLHYPRPSEDSDLAGSGLATSTGEQGRNNQGI